MIIIYRQMLKRYVKKELNFSLISFNFQIRYKQLSDDKENVGIIHKTDILETKVFINY